MTEQHDIRSGKRWYVLECTTDDLGTTERETRMVGKREIRLTPHGLKEIAAKIRAMGFPTIIALHHVRQRAKGRQRIWKAVPAFRQFIFVEFDYYEDRWIPLLRAPGVSRIMPEIGGERPSPVPRATMDMMLEKLRELEAATLDVVVKRTKPAFSKGEAVRVTAQPDEGTASLFSGQVGIVLVSSAERVKVELSLFGRQTVAEVAAGDLEAVA